jgi:hypothetical protein
MTKPGAAAGALDGTRHICSLDCAHLPGAQAVGRPTVSRSVAPEHDGLIKRNPLPDQGRAGDDESDEGPVPSVGEVLRVVEALPARFRMMALLATFTSRGSVLAALSRREVDVSTGYVTVLRNQAQLKQRSADHEGPEVECRPPGCAGPR